MRNFSKENPPVLYRKFLSKPRIKNIRAAGEEKTRKQKNQEIRDQHAILVMRVKENIEELKKLDLNVKTWNELLEKLEQE